MDQALRELLDSADDPVNAECDPRLDWSAIFARVAAVQSELERITGRPFTLDDNAQDATFFAELSLRRPGSKPNWIDYVFAVRFSYFGMLFTTWSHCETERLPDAVVEELMAALSRAGFQYVPAEPLAAPYTGRNPAFAGSSWWTRFFDYCPECLERETAAPKRSKSRRRTQR